MAGMGHAIEQAAEVIAEAYRKGGDIWGDDLARALAEAGLLAPAPMGEEWTVMGEFESGDGWVIDVEFATRLGAEDFLARNEWASDDGGYVARRLTTDWMPADEAD